MKLVQMGVPSAIIQNIGYQKTAQISNKDESGNRAAYTAAGIKRGEQMCKLYGDVYSCGLTGHRNSTRTRKRAETNFKHRIKPIKLGILVRDKARIEKAYIETIKACMML